MKRFIAAVLIVLYLFSTIPFYAVAAEIDETGLPTKYLDYSSSYIEFTVRMEDLGVSVTTCLEDFVSGYENRTNTSMEKYIDDLVSMEKDIYYTNLNRIETALSNDNEASAVNSTYASLPVEWYDYIGYTTPTFSQEAINSISYDEYGLLSVVEKGDIVYETDGVVAQIIGHVALVQGIYYSSSIDGYYIRTIEANTKGVVYGVLDDNRYVERGTKVYYAKWANDVNINDAIIFATQQLGKGYNYAGLTPDVGYCKTGFYDYPWYCTELVWASYYWSGGEGGGININEDGTIPQNIYMPSEMATSNELARKLI